jgi:predicted DNA-binding transcriptional regulator AlpA
MKGELMILQRKIDKLQKKAPPQDDKFLSVSEVAEILSANSNSVYKLFHCADFPSKRIKGVGFRVQKSKLFEYIENLKNN